MGKVVKYTGSKLLGEELKRLRGSRKLEDIVDLSKQSPLTSRIHPISAPTLSQIENGITMPSTEVLYSLSVLYGVSPSRLLHHIVEERIATPGELPATREETRDRLREALTAGHWYDALALSIHAGRLAEDEGDRLLCEANRAMALRRLGMRNDAVLLLLQCAESPSFPADHRHVAHFYLAEVLAESGFVQTAADHVERGMAVLPRPTPPTLMANALQRRVVVTLLVADFGLPIEDKVLRECLRDIDMIESLATDAVPERLLKLGIWRAGVTGALGNTLVALRDYARHAKEAARLRSDLLEACAELSLGELLLRGGKAIDAISHLERAENRAVALGDPDTAFRAYFSLADASATLASDRTKWYLRRCLRYWPLVQARTPQVIAFEKMLRQGVV